MLSPAFLVSSSLLVGYYKRKLARGGKRGGAVAGSYTRRGNPWDLVVLNPWNLNVGESYHRDCPVRLLCNRPSRHLPGNLNFSSTRHRSFAGHSGVSATQMGAGMPSTCHTTVRPLADLTIEELDKAGPVTWKMQSGRRAARSDSEISYGRVV